MRSAAFRARLPGNRVGEQQWHAAECFRLCEDRSRRQELRGADQPVELDQNGCLYMPHVLGIQARQQLKVVTSDDTTHNIHPLPKANREWNISQPPKADPIMQTFSRPEERFPSSATSIRG